MAPVLALGAFAIPSPASILLKKGLGFSNGCQRSGSGEDIWLDFGPED